MARKKAETADQQDTAAADNPQSEAPAEGPAETQNTTDDQPADTGEPQNGPVAPGFETAHVAITKDTGDQRQTANTQIAADPPAVGAVIHEAHKGYVDIKGNKVDMTTVFQKETEKGRTYRVQRRVYEETTVPGNPAATRRRIVYGEGRVIPDYEYLEAMDAAERVSGSQDTGQ